MNKTNHCVDFVIIGAGIIGLSIARELTQQYPQAKIAILEKESQIGLHASGRNSGVLHSGIYYPENSLKAKFCLEGARAMAAYCEEHRLPIHRIGKLIVSKKQDDGSTLELLYQRACNNGAKTQLITEDELRCMEPNIRSATPFALLSPETAVVDPKAILLQLYQGLLRKNVTFYFQSRCERIEPQKRKIQCGLHEIAYDHLFNTAGLYADKIAAMCGLGNRYTMIPFKGFYYELKPDSKININHLVYPVPDMNMPFLGIHLTKSIQGKIYIGPNAVPALSREHYQRTDTIKPNETLETFYQLSRLYRQNKQGFRAYAHHEIAHLSKSHFLKSASQLIPLLRKDDILKSKKTGIRAQLLDKQTGELVMDFLVQNTEHETHVLNAVSPAFTSAFRFAQFIVESIFVPET